MPQLFEAKAEGLRLPAALSEGTRAEAVLDALPGKKPLIKLSYRPPNYETPIEYFRTAITPNDAFFVRYHLSNIPEVDPKTWKLAVGGEGAGGQTELNLDDLKKMPAVEVVAVYQCSGNRRGLFQPHVAGVEWGYGAMGCARWKGARLKDVLDKVGVKKDAIEIVFDGADGPVTRQDARLRQEHPGVEGDGGHHAHRLRDERHSRCRTSTAFPARIVVPGWTGTYWMKHVTSIKAVTKPESGFWMNSAYRIPLGKFPLVSRFTTQDTAANTPITEMVVNSLITSPLDGAQVKAGSTVTVEGIAWDGGYGIRTVEVSIDGGKTWNPATLGQDSGPLRLPHVQLPVQAQGARQAHGHGARHQRDRPDARPPS